MLKDSLNSLVKIVKKNRVIVAVIVVVAVLWYAKRNMIGGGSFSFDFQAESKKIAETALALKAKGDARPVIKVIPTVHDDGYGALKATARIDGGKKEHDVHITYPERDIPNTTKRGLLLTSPMFTIGDTNLKELCIKNTDWLPALVATDRGAVATKYLNDPYLWLYGVHLSTGLRAAVQADRADSYFISTASSAEGDITKINTSKTSKNGFVSHAYDIVREGENIYAIKSE